MRQRLKASEPVEAAALSKSRVRTNSDSLGATEETTPAELTHLADPAVATTVDSAFGEPVAGATDTLPWKTVKSTSPPWRMSTPNSVPKSIMVALAVAKVKPLAFSGTKAVALPAISDRRLGGSAWNRAALDHDTGPAGELDLH